MTLQRFYPLRLRFLCRSKSIFQPQPHFFKNIRLSGISTPRTVSHISLLQNAIHTNLLPKSITSSHVNFSASMTFARASRLIRGLSSIWGSKRTVPPSIWMSISLKMAKPTTRFPRNMESSSKNFSNTIIRLSKTTNYAREILSIWERDNIQTPSELITIQDGHEV